MNSDFIFNHPANEQSKYYYYILLILNTIILQKNKIIDF